MTPYSNEAKAAGESARPTRPIVQESRGVCQAGSDKLDLCGASLRASCQLGSRSRASNQGIRTGLSETTMNTTIAEAPAVPMSNFWRTIRDYILWSYERGTMQSTSW